MAEQIRDAVHDGHICLEIAFFVIFFSVLSFLFLPFLFSFLSSHLAYLCLSDRPQDQSNRVYNSNG
jgi:hypothetical protein